MPQLLAGAAAAGIAGGVGATGSALAGTSAIAAGASIAGGATSLAAGTAAAAGGIGSTLLTILSGVASVASVAGTLQAAQSNSTEAFANAVQANVQAGQSQVGTEQQATTLKRELVKVLGENDVAIAAAGIDLSGGIAATSRANANKDTVEQLSISRQDDEMRRALLKARANGYRAQAASYQTGGLLAAIGKGAEFATGVLQRG
jgi:hypothetical protein